MPPRVLSLLIETLNFLHPKSVLLSQDELALAKIHLTNRHYTHTTPPPPQTKVDK